MGRSIDKSIEKMGMTIEKFRGFVDSVKSGDVLIISKEDYEARLKADMVAMLTEIQLEIEEMDSGCGWEGYRPTARVIGLIQQKINALKAESENT